MISYFSIDTKYPLYLYVFACFPLSFCIIYTWWFKKQQQNKHYMLIFIMHIHT